MPEPLLLRDTDKSIAILTLNRPNRLNPLSTDMLLALLTELERISTDPGLRVVILRGAGKAFCAGHDLKEMQAMRQSNQPDQALTELFKLCTRVMLAIRALPQPVIAEVQGLATAAGCQLVATCDLAIAADHVKFGVNGVNIGLFCSTPMVALSRNIARKQAFEMLTTGEFISAPRAAELGLINRAVPMSELQADVLNLAKTIASKLTAAVAIGKEAFYQQVEMPVEQAYDFTGQVMVQNMMRDDTTEGVAAFLEKRPPNWDQDL